MNSFATSRSDAHVDFIAHESPTSQHLQLHNLIDPFNLGTARRGRCFEKFATERVAAGTMDTTSSVTSESIVATSPTSFAFVQA